MPERIELLGRCQYNELPFEINRSRDADETQRLKYRYLDLRNPAVKKNIILRCNVIAALRQAMMAHDFLEITTPILTASSPEGARDYLVPARKHPGKFYALPQAPQQFKQLLMTSGFDRYFQIAPCFRDEDARGDRSPGEFYQLDMEMAFAAQDDVFAVIEDVLPPIFAKYGKYNIASSAPFRRIAYKDALETYGSDKPDLRIDLTCKNISDLFESSEFEPFKGQTVKAVPISNCHLTRKQIEKLLTDCEVQAGTKGYWFKMDENGELAGGVAKFVQGCKDELTERLGLTPNTLVVIAAGASATKLTGVLIKTFGANVEGHMDKERYEFCWIVDFPMYEIGDESGELEFCHNPFSMPGGGAATLDKAIRGEIAPLTIPAQQYDLGLDLGMFKNRLQITSDVYVRNTVNMLVDGIKLPGVYGADSPQTNSADLSTRGYEIAVSWKDEFNLAGHPFGYGISGTLSDYATYVTRYDNNPNNLINDYYVGQRIGDIWGFVTRGDPDWEETISRVEVKD